MSDLQTMPPPAPPPVTPAPSPATGSNGLATAGFVLGLLGFLGSFIPVINVVGIVLGLLGAILAGVGLAVSKRANVGKGLALAGLILGLLAIVIAIAINALFVSGVNTALDEATKVDVKAPANAAGTDSPNAAKESTDSKLGSTRNNPAPIGSTISGGDWSVVINSVQAVEKDSMGQQPAAGHVLILVNLTATYTGDDEQGDSAWSNVEYVTPDGSSIDSTSGSTLFMADDSFDSLKTLYKGASETGNEILEVPADGWQNGVLAIKPDLFKDATFVAVK